MSFLSQAKTKRLLSVHGWSGTVLGLLLYVCIFTGAIVVFADEIAVWSQGTTVSEEGLPSQVDRHFRAAARTVDPTHYEEVQIFRTGTGALAYRFHSHGTDAEGGLVEQGVHMEVDAQTGEVFKRHEGDVRTFPDTPSRALRDFWVNVHVQLHLPNPLGLALVGVLGLAMMAAAISGIFIHGHIFRDAFVATRDRARLVGARDLHVLAGSWGLPFAIILAFTGAFFGFALSLGVPVMALSVFGGDQAALVETLIGVPASPDLTAASLASLDYILADARNRAGGDVLSVLIQHYGTAGAQVRVFVGPAQGALSGTVLEFAGVTRAFEGVRPFFGTEPSAGASLFALMRPLHFGDFAGFGSRLVWFGMGLAMAFVTASGMLLWTQRRADTPGWTHFRHWTVVTIWGLPLAMLASAVAFFATLPAGDPTWWTPAGFLIGAAGAIALGARYDTASARLRLANAALCLSLPVLRHLTGGASWSEALIAGAWTILVVDLLLMLLGLVLLRQRARTELSPSETSRPDNRAGAAQEPAE